MPSSTSRTPGFVLLRAPVARMLACVSTLALLSACASQTRPQLSATQEAAQYVAHARRSYAPPGPAYDPWGPYIVEAAQRFDVPERWIREVMRVESSGKVLDTSPVGAMGLMQVMPVTFDELRARYDLGDDPYDPHDNVMAGTAYLREMYDIYGFPGFLAAYNAGPGRLDDYLTRNRPLPDETRNYVRKIGPYIAGIEPNRPSAASGSAMNQLPLEIPPGPRYPHHQPAPVALAENRYARPAPPRVVQTAALVEPPRPVPPPPVAKTAAVPAPAPHGGFRLIAPAMADTLPVQRVGAGSAADKWAIQVGAFGNEGQARAAADAARNQAHDVLAQAHPAVGAVRSASATLYRARLTGLSRDAAVQACEKLGHGHGACIVLSPESQG
jgi:cell division septation protein DedD